VVKKHGHWAGMGDGIRDGVAPTEFGIAHPEIFLELVVKIMYFGAFR